MSEKSRKELIRIAGAGAIFALLLIVEHAVRPAFMEMRAVSLVLYLIPYLICGLPVLIKAVKGVKGGHMLDESFLMAAASIGAFAVGENAEAAAVMLFYQVGEWFQDRAVARSRESISELMDIAPEHANVERDGEVVTIDPDEVEEGDILVIKPGEKIPVDSVVVEGESYIDTAALTGEAVPRRAAAGDTVISGCVNGDGLLRVRAAKSYDDSTVSKILELVEEASDRKSRTEQFITRFAKYYTPIVVAAAAVLALVPPIFAGNILTWVYRACTFLVISCPCALVISVPLAFFGGVGAASRQGVLVKGSNYLELMAGLGTLVTDKTGTLTLGKLGIRSLIPCEGCGEEELLAAAAAGEFYSTHPIGKSIVEECRARYPDTDVSAIAPKDVENVPGEGIAAGGPQGILIGKARFLEARGVRVTEAPSPGYTTCYVAKGGRFLGSILLGDEIKPGAKEAVSDIKAAGVGRVVLFTGDGRDAACETGRILGIDEVKFDLLPEDKVGELEKLMGDGSGGYTAFVGDGINDAPVLMRSDVGIAMGSMGSDAAIEAADIVIMDDDIRRIPAVINTARRTVRTAKQNIVFALAVKALILVLGALGYANMWAAVFADVGVAVLCILNSMRLMLIKKV